MAEDLSSAIVLFALDKSWNKGHPSTTVYPCRANTDRRDFVIRLSSLLVETDTDCYAWALIPNHFHFLLKPRGCELQHFIRRLLTGYAVNFNKRHHRSGHLFKNLYKSIVCEEDAYLLELIRYIHLNPLRAGQKL